MVEAAAAAAAVAGAALRPRDVPKATLQRKQSFDPGRCEMKIEVPAEGGTTGGGGTSITHTTGKYRTVKK